MANILPNHTETDEQNSVEKLLKAAPKIDASKLPDNQQSKNNTTPVNLPSQQENNSASNAEDLKGEQNDMRKQNRTANSFFENGDSADNAKALLQEQLYQKYGWKPQINQTQQDYIDSIVEQSDTPVDDSYRLHSAIAFSQWQNIPVSYAYEHLDELYEQNLGKKYHPNATAFQSIINSATVGANTVSFQQGTYRWKQLVQEGKMEEANALEQQLLEQQEYMDSLQDYMPRSWATKILQWTANTIPYSLSLGAQAASEALGSTMLAVGGATALGIGGLSAGAQGLTLGATLGVGGLPVAAIVGAGITAATFNESKKLFEGEMYWQLMHQTQTSPDGSSYKIDIDPNTAARIAEWDGIINGMVEADLSATALAGKAISKAVLGQTASKVMAKLMAKGVTNRFILGLAEQVAENNSEGIQEFTEDMVDTFATNMAYELSGYAKPEKITAALKKAASSYGQAFVSTMIMGLPISIKNAQVSVQNAKNLNSFMKFIPSKETAVNSEFVQSQKPEGVNAADWSQAAGDMWERYHGTDSTTKEASKPKETLNRTENGQLYTKDELVTSKDSTGTESRRFLIGDPKAENGKRGKLYGYIEYDLSDNGAKLEITDIKMRNEVSGSVKEAVIDLIGQYPNSTIEWHTVNDKNLEAVKQEIIASNPLGAEHGLQYNLKDSMANNERMQVTQAIAKGFGNGLDNSQLQVATDLLYAMAEGKGMTGLQYMTQNFAPDAFRSIKDLHPNQLKKIMKDNGITEGTLQYVKGMQLAQAGKSVIYAGEHADFSTFSHEAFHALEMVTDKRDSIMSAIVDMRNDGSLAKYIQTHKELFPSNAFGEDVAKSVDEAVSQWQAGQNPTRLQSEVMARLFEGYLYDGKTFSAKLKQLFAKIADWMRRIYQTMKTGGVTLSDDVVKQFDALLSNQDSGFNQSENQQQQQEKAQKTAAQTETKLQTSFIDEEAENETEEFDNLLFQVDSNYKPDKTGIGYKLFEQNIMTGELFPLFIGSKQSVPVGEWLVAQNLPTKGFAKRPGWHIGADTPDAPWLKNAQGGYSSRRGKNFRRAYAEVEYPMDKDWQSEADKSKTKDLPNTIPENGYYKFKEGQRGTWIVSGAMKVNRVLEDSEVAAILASKGYDADKAFSPYREKFEKRANTMAKKSHTLFQTSNDDQKKDIDLANGIEQSDADSNISSMPVEVSVYDNDMSATSSFLSSLKSVMDIPAYSDDMFIIDEKGDLVDSKEAYQAYVDRYVKPLIEKNAKAVPYQVEIIPTDTIGDFIKKNYQPLNLSGDDVSKDRQFSEAVKNDDTLKRILAVFGNIIMLDDTSLNAYYQQVTKKIHGQNRQSNERLVEPFIDEAERKRMQISLEKIIDDKDVIKAMRYVLQNKPFPSTTGLLESVRTELSRNARFYRNALSSITGDDTLKAQSLVPGSGLSEAELQEMPISKLSSLRSDQMVNDTIKNLKDGKTAEDKTLISVVKSLKKKLDEANMGLQKAKDLEDSVTDKEKTIRERDRQIAGILDSLDSIRSKLGVKNNSSPLLDRYKEINSILINLGDEAGYQDMATAKGSREKGIAIGAKRGTQKWIHDMTEMFPQLKPEAGLSARAYDTRFRENVETWKQQLIAEKNEIRAKLAEQLAVSLDKQTIEAIRQSKELSEDSVLKQAATIRDSLDGIRKVRNHARQVLVDSLTTDERLRIIAQESATFGDFKESVMDDFVEGRERIPQTDKETFLRTAWTLASVLPDGDSLYGDAPLTTAAKKMESFNDFQKWVEENDQDILKSIDKGNETTLENWLRSIYQESNATDSNQFSTPASVIEEQERQRVQDNARDKKFKERLMTDEGLAGFLSVIKDWTLVPEEVRLVNGIQDATQEEIDEARNALLSDIRYSRWIFANQSGNVKWSVNNLEGSSPEIDDPTGRMRYKMSDSVRKRRQKAKTIKNRKLQEAVANGDEKYVNGIADEIISSANAEIDRLSKVLKDQKRQAKNDKDEAVKTTKETLRSKEAEKREARKTKEYMQSLADFITSKTPGTVDIKVAMTIRKLVAQSGIDPHFRQGGAQFNGKYMSLDEIREELKKNGMDENTATISATLFDKLTKKPLQSWTVSDLEDLAQQVANLREWGRILLDQRKAQFKALSDSIKSSLRGEIQDSGKRPTDSLPVTAEAKSDARKQRSIKGMGLVTFNPEHVARILDSGKQSGGFFDVLVRSKRKARDVELQGINKRLETVAQAFSNIGYKMEDAQRLVEIPGGEHITVSELMYAVLVQRNERSHDAYVYGKLVDKAEKRDILSMSSMNGETVTDQNNWANNEVRRLGNERYQMILSIADDQLSEKDRQAMEIVFQDMNSQLGRINDVANEVYNIEVNPEEAYVPIQRMGDREGQDENSHQMMANLFGRGADIDNATGVMKGFTIDRITINPMHQTSVNSDLFTVWSRSLSAQEHFIAFSNLNKIWNSVFRSGTLSSISNDVGMYYGKAYTDYLSAYMNEVISPKPVIDASSKLVQFLRGNLPAAYLAFKPSGVVLQLITSPAAFLKEVNPASLSASLLRTATDYKGTLDFVNQRSVFMKNRSMNPYMEVQRLLSKDPTLSKWARGLSKFQNAGMMGLEVADRVSVYAGWVACYNSKLQELGGIETEENVLQASRYADEVVHNTQPVSDDTELAPLFKGDTFKRAFTQFGVAMNVIWNNITVDTWSMAKTVGDKNAPKEAKAHAFRQLVGMIGGYALAGVVLGMVQQGFKPDDDDKDKAKKVAYYSTSQFVGSVPLLSDGLDSILRYWITGEKNMPFAQTFYPGLYAIRQGLTAKSTDTAAKNISKGAGILLGLPVSAEKQFQEAIEKRSVLPLLGR